MSLEATQWAWKQSGLSPGAKLVLLYLADAANRENGFLCWMANPTIAKATGQGVRTVYDALSELKSNGVISCERESPGSSRIWRLNFESHPGKIRRHPGRFRNAYLYGNQKEPERTRSGCARAHRHDTIFKKRRIEK